MNVSIHPTAIVAKEAELSDGVVIGPYSLVDAKVKLGAGTELKAFSHVCDYTVLGKNCIVMEHANIGAVPQDLSFKGEISYTEIGDNVTLREYVTVNRATGEGNTTKIGNNVLLMEGVHIAHNVELGSNITVANKTGIAGHVHVDDFTVIGGMSGFHQFVRIGKYCMIGGMARVTQDVPPYCLASGNPMYVYDINKIGLTRRGFSEEQRRFIRRIYKIVYGSNLKREEAIAEIGSQFANDLLADEIINFIRSAERGIAPRIDSVKKK